MTREEIYNSIWTIAQEEVTSQGYRFAADTEGQIKEFIRHGVYNNMTATDIFNGSKIAVLCNELGGFGSFDNPKSFSVGFALSKDISSNNIFLILEAAIEAAGDDYNSVMKSLGVANGNRYSIPGEYNKEITFNKKKYFLTSADDMIIINISIPK